MRLLLDQGLPRSAVDHLRRGGIDAVHRGEIGTATADDASILDHARDEDRIVVTLDADFHRLLALAGASRPTVVRVRIEGIRVAQLAELIRDVIATCDEDMRAGAMVTVQEDGLGVRRLPLVRLGDPSNSCP